MAQTNAVQDQPSMDDILASIRRIIDDGNKKPETSVPSQESVANDDASTAAKPVEAAPAQQAAPEVGIPELDSFLESLDAKYEQGGEEAASSAEPSSNVVTLDTSDNVEPAIVEKLAQVDVPARAASKYEARFSDTDRTAFAEVGDVLSANTAPTAVSSPALISDNARQAVGLSFEDLSAALMKEAGKNLPDLTQQMLKPMLTDWLDNNLPSMVERLVRSEIERIARGD